MDKIGKNIIDFATENNRVIDNVVRRILRQNHEYTDKDIYNRCLVIIWKKIEEKGIKNINKVILYRLLYTNVLKEIFIEKDIILKDRKYKEKFPTIEILDNIEYYSPKNNYLDLIPLLLKYSSLTEIELVIIVLFYDLEIPESMLDEYKEIIDREPGYWNSKEISIYLKKPISKVSLYKKMAIKKIKEYVKKYHKL